MGIFNISLSQSAIPTCFKMATIVPVPKKAKVTEFNGYRPVPATLDQLQFAYSHSRSTDDAIAITLHTALSHLDKRNTYVRMLFIDYSSAFNTIVPSKLIIKLEALGLILNTGAPQGCMLSPLLYSLFTQGCMDSHASNST
jgi:gmma-aminobutyric acid receptor subunit gamma/cGMP-dependent protein kinase 2